MLGCAVGCRPMVIVYLPLLVMMLWQKRPEGEQHPLRWAMKRWHWLILPGLLAASYMTLNALRFGDPFEFGHRYLPEFVREPQFSLRYLPHNLAQLFRFPSLNEETGLLSWFTFDCQAFWLIAPFWIFAALAYLHALIHRRAKAVRYLLPVLLLIHLLIVLCHRTLGGWQFGNRYLVDLLPWLFYGFLCWAPEDARFMKAGLPLMCLGVSVNLIGLAATYNHWI